MIVRARYKKPPAPKLKEAKVSELFSSKYLDTSRLSKARTVSINQLRIGWVNSSTPEQLSFDTDMITITDGWVEVIMIMLHMLYLDNPKEFIFKIAEYGIGNNNIKIDNVYGTIDIDGRKRFTSYKLYDTEFHVEINEDALSIMQTIANLCKALGYETKSVKIRLITRKE